MTQKEWQETIECWWFFSSSAHLFFNEIAIFSANAPHMISQPIDKFLPTLLLLHAQIHYNWATRQKEWWETVVFFDSSVILLTFFNQITVLGENAWFVISQVTDIFCPTATSAHLRWLKQIRDTKRMVRNHCALTILQFLYSPFYWLHCYTVGANVQSVIGKRQNQTNYHRFL